MKGFNELLEEIYILVAKTMRYKLEDYRQVMANPIIEISNCFPSQDSLESMINVLSNNSSTRMDGACGIKPSSMELEFILFTCNKRKSGIRRLLRDMFNLSYIDDVQFRIVSSLLEAFMLHIINRRMFDEIDSEIDESKRELYYDFANLYLMYEGKIEGIYIDNNSKIYDESIPESEIADLFLDYIYKNKLVFIEDDLLYYNGVSYSLLGTRVKKIIKRTKVFKEEITRLDKILGIMSERIIDGYIK